MHIIFTYLILITWFREVEFMWNATFSLFSCVYGILEISAILEGQISGLARVVRWWSDVSQPVASCPHVLCFSGGMAAIFLSHLVLSVWHCIKNVLFVYNLIIVSRITSKYCKFKHKIMIIITAVALEIKFGRSSSTVFIEQKKRFKNLMNIFIYV